MTVAIISAVYDHWDPLKPIRAQHDIDVEWIAVTDDPVLGSGATNEPLGWRTVYHPKPGVHPCLAAKEPKMCPQRFTDARTTIWLDASFRVTSPTFVVELLARLGEERIGQFAHPWRDCIYDEAEVAAAMARYDGQPIAEQAAYYQAMRHPAHWGLWETGVIVRRHTPLTESFGLVWLAENERWSHQDQISEAPILRAHGLRPVTLGPSSRDCAWLEYQPSVRHG